VSYLLNDRAQFADEMVEGFVAANGSMVRRVDGGVARRSGTPAGEVAIVVGGGSGHYPAFAGLVGQGLAHGAAMGNVFASPSARQVHSVARAVAADAGVLLTYGNYAGDVLNFDQAQERLVAEGIPCRTLTVTDDIASAADTERHLRRGVAGDLIVFRAAAWASEQGRDLDGVWDLAHRANERTRTLGVAFSGCTLPGADEPLFTVPQGRMAVGMGIHGEPGVDEVPMPTADELAQLLVGRLLEEAPASATSAGDARAAVILNGLGSVKSEELFVTYRAVARLLGDAGITPVQPEVGELVTSFEMAGVSLTLCWLDEELEAAWTSPVAAPAFRRGVVEPAQGRRRDGPTVVEQSAPSAAGVPDATGTSREAATVALTVLRAMERTIDQHTEHLGRLDAVAGDGDHGIGMQRGVAAAVQAAAEAVDAEAGAGSTLVAAGDAWAHRAGGTSGALWGAALRTVGSELGDELCPDGPGLAAAVRRGADTIARMGKAAVGDKTMLDAIVPFADELARGVEDGASVLDAWTEAARVATRSAEETADLLPRAGRARTHLEKSRGTPDPGAVSFALAVTAVAQALAELAAAEGR
jgi:dihydroxyacetone kinase